jgi:hypothetical protein
VEDSAPAVESVEEIAVVTVDVDAVDAVDVVAVAERARCALSTAMTTKLNVDNGAGEGMAARDQARSSRKGRQDQEHGGDVRAK